LCDTQNAAAAQLLKLAFGCPSSNRFPIRFTASLRMEAAHHAKCTKLPATQQSGALRYGLVTFSRMKSLALVPMGTLKVCCGGDVPVLPVSATGIQLPASSV
jgi:hypothetical protein